MNRPSINTNGSFVNDPYGVAAGLRKIIGDRVGNGLCAVPLGSDA